jgi:hypothetical protein
MLHRILTYNLETCCKALNYLGLLKSVRFTRSSYIEGHRRKIHIYGCWCKLYVQCMRCIVFERSRMYAKILNLGTSPS